MAPPATVDVLSGWIYLIVGSRQLRASPDPGRNTAGQDAGLTFQFRAALFTADTTARSDAVVIDGAMPTPHTVRPTGLGRGPASPGFAALAILTDLMGEDPLRPASPRSRSSPKLRRRPPPGHRRPRSSHARSNPARPRRNRRAPARRRTRPAGRCRRRSISALHAVDLDGRGDLVMPLSSSAASTRCFIRSSGRIGAKYSSLKASHISLGLTSPPSPAALGDLLDHLGELDLQPSRQRQAVVGLHDVGHPALAGLRVDPDHRLVGAADVARDRSADTAPATACRRRRNRRRPQSTFIASRPLLMASWWLPENAVYTRSPP